MEAPNTPAAVGPRRLSLRAFRPLLWWLILVLVLFAIRTHQRWMEQTRLTFSLTMDGKPAPYDVDAFFDDRRIADGQRIPLGWHKFAISHAKTDPFSTNLFIWYGGHDLGEITLNRAKGILAIRCVPPAGVLTISGPEFDITLTNTAGLTSSVPTDRYLVEANYAHWQDRQQLAVMPGFTTTWRFAPQLGTVQLTCNQSDASFELRRGEERLIASGRFPAGIPEVPAGNYKLHAWHHQSQRNERLVVAADSTNDFDVRFLYGSAVIRTEPAGADVNSSDGRYWGVTPLQISELPTGTWNFNLRRFGYQPAMLTLQIATEQTNTVQTNLINSSYVQDMQTARQYFAAKDFDRALEVLDDALVIRPNDSDATALQTEASGWRSLRQAESLGKQEDYIGGIKELQAALKWLPGNESAQHMLGEFKQHEPEQIERLRKERLECPKKAFEAVAGRYKDSDLFEEHEIKTSKPAGEVHAAIIKMLRDVQPAFVVIPYKQPGPETFALEAKQEPPGGMRRCFIVCGQTKDDETQILFKVLEFKNHHSVSITGGLSFNTDYIPLHVSRIPDMDEKLQAQLKGGVDTVTERIQEAIRQIPNQQALSK